MPKLIPAAKSEVWAPGDEPVPHCPLADLSPPLYGDGASGHWG